MPINNNILNQKGTPAFYSDIFANRPAFGYAGRVFISTDTGAIYEDTGSAWTLIADAGAGTTGTLQQVTTNGNTTTLGVTIQGIDINDGAGTGLYNTSIGTSSLSLNTTGASNTAIGNGSMSSNTTGGLNTAVGYGSMLANTTGLQNVAIGYTALLNNTTGQLNTAVGSGALSLNTTGTQNTAIGNASLTANTTGLYNTAVGQGSMQLNTTGAQNTSLGTSSLNSNTTASNNTGIGYSSLYANTTGANNSAVGSGALSLNTTGLNNTAIGHSSMGANLTGSYNAALGISSLSSNTTGSYNVAIGQETLKFNTTGVTNTGVGNSVLSANISGQANTAIGAGALQSNTSANSNTAIGVSALGSNTTGTLNTAIGYSAGSSITTGSNNTIIGNYAGTTTLANNIVLSDGVGNVRLFSDANGLIGIGQAVGTPGGQLDIHTSQTYALVLNGLTTNNAYTAFSNASVGKWRIGNTYNAGANSFDIYNLGTSSTTLSFNSTTNASTFIGKMNIGTRSASPIRNLNIYGATNDNAIIKLDALDGNGYGAQIDYSSKTSGGTTNTWTLGTGVSQVANSFEFFNGTSTTMALTIGGNVGIGTITPTAISGYGGLTLSGTDGSLIDLRLNNSDSGRIYTNVNTSIGLECLGTNPIVFKTNSGSGATERMRITDGGNVLIGSTTDDTTNKLQVTGSVRITGNSFLTGYIRSNTGYETRIDGSGSINPSFYLSNVANSKVWNLQLGGSNDLTTWYFDGSSWAAKGYQTTSGNWTNSDIRKKKEIELLDYGLNEVLSLIPKKYKYIHDTDNKINGKKDMGFIAQEVINIIPEAVGSYIENDTEFLSMSYTNLVPVLVKAIQELNEKLVRNNIN